MSAWEPTKAETAMAYRTRDLLIDNPQELRVLCPRGHFIAQVGIYVLPTGGDNAPIWLYPRGPKKEYGGNMHADLHGFRMETVRSAPNTVRGSVRLNCTNSKCRYKGSFNHARLSVELAAVALAGTQEYRMTH